MRQFPNTPEYIGLNTPLGEEYEIGALAVEGRIPPDVEGVFFRAVPDPAFPPFVEDGGAILSGDGMVSAVRLAGGKAGFAIRYVQTARHQAEVAAGRALFGKYRNPFTDQPDAKGVDRTVANTTPVWHAGRLLMTKEDGRPYRVDPRSLETLGRYDFGGRLRSETMTAHVRIDPETGEMFFFGYEADGLASTKVAYCIADKQGNLIREQWFDAPYCALMHDFVITERYALFPIYPTTCDAERVRAGGDHWVHEMGRDSWVGVMPRYGDVAEMRWFRGPKGVSCFHMMNAFDDDAGRIQFDQCLSSVNVFPFIQRASGLNVPPAEAGSRLARWTIDLENGSDAVTETVIGPPGRFPDCSRRASWPPVHACLDADHEPGHAGPAGSGRTGGCHVQPAAAARLHRQAAAGARAAAGPVLQRARPRPGIKAGTRRLACHGRGPSDRAVGLQPRRVDTRCGQRGCRSGGQGRHPASTAPAGARLVGERRRARRGGVNRHA